MVLAKLSSQQIIESDAVTGTSAHTTIDIVETIAPPEDYEDTHRRSVTSEGTEEVSSQTDIDTTEDSTMGRNENPDVTGVSAVGEVECKETRSKAGKISVMVR